MIQIAYSIGIALNTSRKSTEEYSIQGIYIVMRSHFKFQIYSLPYLMRAIARAHANTRATSLMRVKNYRHHFCL